MVDPMLLGSSEPHPLADQFIAMMAERDDPSVLEIGTRRWSDLITHHKAWVPHAGHYVMADIEPGLDVDVVTDVRALNFVGGQFSAVISVAVLEHISHPALAMAEVARVLHRGGLLYLQTHQSFPLHGEDGMYGGDFYRFSRGALHVLAEDAGLDVVATGYTHPVKLVPQTRVDRWNTSDDVEAYLCVDLLATKP